MYRKQLLTIWIRIHVPPDYKDRFQAWVKYGQHFRQTQRVIWRMLEAKTAWQSTYSFFFKNYPDTNILSMKSNFATNIIRHWSWAALCLLCFCDFLSVIEVAVEILTGEADATCMQYHVSSERFQIFEYDSLFLCDEDGGVSSIPLLLLAFLWFFTSLYIIKTS